MNNTKHHRLSLDKEIQDLIATKQNINALIKEYQNTRKRLCLLLAQIKINKLYEQINLQSFKDYVTSKRLKISYNTALEYAKIGELLLNYEEELVLPQTESYFSRIYDNYIEGMKYEEETKKKLFCGRESCHPEATFAGTEAYLRYL